MAAEREPHEDARGGEDAERGEDDQQAAHRGRG
jgi:hypothetical protein